MTLLSVVKDVCAAVGVIVPTSVFSGIVTNRTMQEMLSLANEMAQRIASDERDWTRLKVITTLTGDGVTTAFNLPANYKRMLVTANVWRSTMAHSPMQFISNTDDWLQRRAQSWEDDWGEWTMMGGQIHIFPVMAVGETSSFAYLNKNCIRLVSSDFGDAFQNDLDTFVLDERLLKLGMIMQWKANKGNAYAEDMGTWQDAMNKAMGADSPAPIMIDRLSTSAFTRFPLGAPL